MKEQFRHFQQGKVLKTFKKLFIARTGQKFAHFMSLLLLHMYARAHPNWPLPSFPPREEAEISSVRKSPKATPTSQADAVTHPPLQSLRVGQYIIPLPPYPSPVFQCVSRLGPVGEARLFCQNCLPCPPPPPLPQQHLARAWKCWLAWENSGVKCPQPRAISRGRNTCAYSKSHSCIIPPILKYQALASRGPIRAGPAVATLGVGPGRPPQLAGPGI